MQFPVAHFTVLYVLVHVNAVPHRNFSPLSRDPFRASAWNRIQEKPTIRESPRNVTSQSSGNDGIVAVRSSTERGSKVRTFSNRVYTPRLWRPKTVTKKMDRRPRLVRKYPSPLISGHRQLPQLPKCHMPWINELSKIQFYWDGINALCDIAMTFESCTTSGSICRRYPVEFTCCPATSLPVLEKCYKGQQTPENVCLPTTVQMSGMSMASRFINRQSRPNRPSRPVQSSKPSKPSFSRGRIERVITEPQYPVNQVRIAGCSPECSPAWVNMFANIKPVQNESLPVCEFPDVFQSCLSPGYKCATHPVDSTCCPLRCIPELEKCYTENPPESVCTPRSLTPWIRRIRKYFG